MKLKVVCKKVYDYIRYDLKEIAFPSSLPDPPHIKKRRKLNWHERFLVSFSLSHSSFYFSFGKQLGSHSLTFCANVLKTYGIYPFAYIVVQVLKEASRLYAASWVRDIGPELRPNDYKKHEESESESEDKPSGAKSKTKEKEPSTLEDLGKNFINFFLMVLFLDQCYEYFGHSGFVRVRL
jgi:hypothetical protein